MSYEIFAREPWYLERPEPEEAFTGFLEPVTFPSGPAGRPALSLVLHTETADLPVYAAGVEGVLRQLIGRPVIVWGKRVDFRPAGFGIELWIREIEAAPLEP